MSNSDIPPDDFSATTPNIKVPKRDEPSSNKPSSSDWEKTNYNYSAKDLQSDEWSKPPSNTPKPPPNKLPAKDADWGMTQANINLPGNQSNQSNQYDNPIYDDFSEKRSGYGETSVGIKLPRNEEPRYEEPKRQEAKYQEPPKKETAEEKKEEKKKGGIPGWLWATAGLLGMFLFATVVLLGVYFFFLGKTGFEVVLKGVPVRSDVLVDGSFWGVTDSDGTIRLKTLKAGQTKKIEIKNPAYKCEEIVIPVEKAKDGIDPIQENARCTNTGPTPTPSPGPSPGPTPDIDRKCLEITFGDFETSRKCAYTKLDELEKDEKNGKMYTVDQLLFAMNLYIVNFDKKKWDIKPIDMRFVDRASGFIKKLPAGTIIEVGGHTDSDGTDQDNQVLSENRAKSVMTALLQFGVNPAMLKMQGYGEKRPKPGNTNSNDTEKFRNRRIEYTVLAK